MRLTIRPVSRQFLLVFSVRREKTNDNATAHLRSLGQEGKILNRTLEEDWIFGRQELENAERGSQSKSRRYDCFLVGIATALEESP